MNITRIIVTFVMLLSLQQVNAQTRNINQRNINPTVPLGQVIYSLPSTALSLKVSVESISFEAGPYARYAQKYLGVKASGVDEINYRLIGVELTPYLEADQEKRYTINLTSEGASINFLRFTSQGLVALSDIYIGKQDIWRFPSQVPASAFAETGTTSNLAETQTTLYRNVRTTSGISRTPVIHSQIVEKSSERKAQEIASLIFKLKQKRINIILGDTDAIFEGEAMGAALEEISRLEKEYIELFLGKSTIDIQVVNFDIVPNASRGKQLYIAFRFSEAVGLLSSSNVLGRPIVIDIIKESMAAPVSSLGKSKSPKNTSYIYYGIPSNCGVRVLDGQKILLETRIPIYQLGEVQAFPVLAKAK